MALTLYISEAVDATQSLVFSQTNPVPIPFPPLTYGDSEVASIFLVDGSGNIAGDSGQAGSTVVVSLGLLQTGAAVWSTSSFTLLTGPNGWQGTLNPTGSNLLALFNGRSQMYLAIQVRITNAAGNTTTWLSMPVLIINSMAPAGSVASLQYGTVALPQGVSTYTVTGLALPSVPKVIFTNILKPPGALNIFPTGTTGYTTAGFTVDLSGVTDSGNYVLEYQLNF